MYHHRLQIRAWGAPWKRAVDLVIARQVAGESNFREILVPGEADGLVTPDVFEWRSTSAAELPQATATIEDGNAQQLMDDLWAAGLRPTEGSGSAGALAATQEHVADLRKVLFHQLGIVK